MSPPVLTRKSHHDRLVLDVMETDDHTRRFSEAVSRGLGARPKNIPPMFFYDEEGSLLFEQITELEAYYPTRTEAAILARYGEDIVSLAGGKTEGDTHLSVVELGSGSSTKTRLLLDLLAARQETVHYTPIDISQSVVADFGISLLEDYPSLHIRGLICDYHHGLQALERGVETPRLFLFLGSSLGNHSPDQAVHLLNNLRRVMAPNDRFLLGVDMKKDAQVLQRAYDDEQGVTAAFNLNLLHRINRELGGEFNTEWFAHKALYNQEAGRIEMHLESLRDQIAPIRALNKSFSFYQGETLHTENSYKYDTAQLEALAAKCGLQVLEQWMDEKSWFSLNLFAPV